MGTFSFKIWKKVLKNHSNFFAHFSVHIGSVIISFLSLEEGLGIRIRRIRMFLGIQDPDPLVRGMDPDPSLF
jgi:hypothetical protein